MKTQALVTLFAFSSLFIFAEDIEPEEPGIVLPPMLLEVEDLRVEDIQAALPEDEEQLIPEISIPLPAAEELYLPEEVFDVPFPDLISAAPPGLSSSRQEGNNLFTQGQIGAGSMNHVLGSVSLFRLRPDPEFRLSYLHEKLDGYGLRPAGSGFFHIEDVLQVSLSHNGETLYLDVNAEIMEREDGLQTYGTYESVNHRHFLGGVSSVILFSDLFSLVGDFETRYVSKVLSADSPLSLGELNLHALVAARITAGNFLSEIQGRYRFGWAHTLGDFSNFFNFTLTGAYTVADILEFSAEVGLAYTVGETPLVPFDLGIEGRWGSWLRFALSGGYEVSPLYFYDLYNEFAYLDGDVALDTESGWFADALVQLRLWNALLLDLQADFAVGSNVLIPDAAIDAITGLFGYSQGDFTTLATDVGIQWDMSRAMSLSVGWQGKLLDIFTFDTAHLLRLGFDIRTTNERFNAYLQASLEIADPLLLPEIAIGLGYRIVEGVELKVDIFDPLSPFLDTPRLYWDPYEEPGFRVVVSTGISL